MSMSPAILGHAKDVYAEMVKRAQADGQGNVYFEGALTRLVQDIGLSNPYYTSVTQCLKAMDCIRQGRRGGGGQGSIWYLLQEPSDELFAAHVGPDRPGHGPAKSAKIVSEELSAANKALHGRISRLEAEVAILKEKAQ